jgi:predicted nucleotidyltransferase
MDKAIDVRITKYLDLIKEKFQGIETAYLFGSYAKGVFSEDSDIDIALIFKELDDSNRFDIQVQLMLLAIQIDSRIEPHPISHNDFYSGNPFAVEIKKTGLEIFSDSTRNFV